MKEILAQGLAHYSGHNIPIDEYDEAFSPFEIENIALNNKQTTMDVSWLSLKGFSVIQRETHESVFQYGRSVDNAFTFFLPSPQHCAVNNFIATGKTDTSSFIVNPGQKDGRIISGGGPNFAMAFELESLKGLLSTQEMDQLLENGANINRANLDAKKLQEVSNSFSMLFKNSERSNDLMLAEHLKKAVFDSLMMLELSENRVGNMKVSANTLVKAIDFIKGNYAKQINIGQIADNAHTCVRNLQYIFKAALGMTPMQFLRCYRLYKFHSRLSLYKTVKEAAISCGFLHIGRATQTYKETYGDIPSHHIFSPAKSNFFSWLSQHPAKQYIF